MLTDWKFWILSLLGFIALGLSLSNYELRNRTVDKQQSVLDRQQYINEAQQLSKFNSQFIRALASLAAQTNDSTIQQLLVEHGITYSVNAPTAQGETPGATK